MTVRQVILASTSPYRRELFARLRIPFDTAAPRFEELPAPTAQVTAEEVRQLVLQNARGKAGSLRDAYPDGLLLASDQVGECEGRILNKPLTEERAVEQLLFLRGREHRLHTAVVLLDSRSGREVEEVVVSPLRMRDLREEQVRRYVRLEQPLQCAGSYLSEGLGVALFERMGGDDPTAIVGLPLITVTRMLAEFGVDPLRAERP
jgi:septum formation protein